MDRIATVRVSLFFMSGISSSICSMFGAFLGYGTARKEVLKSHPNRIFILERTFRYSMIGAVIGICPIIGVPIVWRNVNKSEK